MAEIIPAEPEQKTEPKTFSEEYVTGLRNEAAAARVAKKDAVEAERVAVTDRLTTEFTSQITERDSKIAELETDVSTRDLEILKLRTILADPDFDSGDVLSVADLVKGTDESSISASVAQVKAIYSKKQPAPRAIDPSQGSGGVPALNSNKLVEALSRAVGARS